MGGAISVVLLLLIFCILALLVKSSLMFMPGNAVQQSMETRGRFPSSKYQPPVELMRLMGTETLYSTCGTAEHLFPDALNSLRV